MVFWEQSDPILEKKVDLICRMQGKKSPPQFNRYSYDKKPGHSAILFQIPFLQDTIHAVY